MESFAGIKPVVSSTNWVADERLRLRRVYIF